VTYLNFLRARTIHDGTSNIKVSGIKRGSPFKSPGSFLQLLGKNLEGQSWLSLHNEQNATSLGGKL